MQAEAFEASIGGLPIFRELDEVHGRYAIAVRVLIDTRTGENRLNSFIGPSHFSG